MRTIAAPTPHASQKATAERRLKAWLIHHWLALQAMLLAALAIVIRAAVVPFQGWDYKDYFRHWFATLANSPSLTAFGQASFSDYTPPYLYLLKLGALLLPTQPLLVVKGISFAFEALLALAVFLLVRQGPAVRCAPLVAAELVLFSPTVLFDGAVWGQSDAIYTSLLVLSVCGIVGERNLLAVVAFGLAFAFKAQAIFLLPLLGVAYLRRDFSIRLFLIVPLVYVLLMVPAVLGGLDWGSALRIYLQQANFYKQLAMNAPTVFAWIPNQYYGMFVWFGLAWAAAVALGIVSLAIVARRPLTPTFWVRLALALVLVVPYVTPGMHDRYFYPADVLSLVYAFYVPRRFYLPVLVTGISLLSYVPYLFDRQVVPIGLLSVAMLLPIGIVLYDYVASLSPTCSVSSARSPASSSAVRPWAIR